jgi:hypothetical protein
MKQASRGAVAAAVAMATLLTPSAVRADTAYQVGKPVCRPGDRPETGLEGQVPVQDRLSGYAAGGYHCNLKEIGRIGSVADNPLHPRLSGWANADAYGNCFYAGDGNDLNPLAGNEGGTLAYDVSDPRHPVQTDYITHGALQGPWESLRANVARGLLVADHQTSDLIGGLTFGGATGADRNGTSPLDIYDVASDCGHPRLLSSTVMPEAAGHEGWFQPDGNVYYMTNAGGPVWPVDLRDPQHPRELAEWSTSASHGGSTSADGTRTYKCSGSGVSILDTSQIAAGQTTSDPSPSVIGEIALPNTSACQETYPVFYGKRPYLIQFGELPGFVRGCDPAGKLPNFSRPNIIDISDERHPTLVATLLNEVADPKNCVAVQGDVAPAINLNAIPVSTLFLYGTHMCSVDRLHNPTVLACAEFYSGIRVYDIRDPLHAKEIAYFNTGTLSPSDPTLDMAASRPIIRADRREIWYDSLFDGFHVLKFERGSGYPFPETNVCPAKPDWVIAQYNPRLQATCAANGRRRPRLAHRRLAGHRLRLRLLRPLPGTQSVRFVIGRRVVVDRRRPFVATIRRSGARRVRLRATLFPSRRTVTTRIRKH